MKKLLLIFSILFFSSLLSAQVVLNRVDNFEDEMLLWFESHSNDTELPKVNDITTPGYLSTEKFQDNNTGFSISPNPAKDKLNIILPSNSSNMKLEVFDILGKRVYNGFISQLSSSIDVSNWKSGVYLVRISNNETTQTKRFIKQ